MRKKSFFNRETTAVTALFDGYTPDEMLQKIRAAHGKGADGIAIDIGRLGLEFRTKDMFKRFMDEAPLPFMFICYRSCVHFPDDDAKRQESLLTAAEAGAEVIDVMGDLYAPCENELTVCGDAVAKQKDLIAAIHERGAKALMSSHMHNLPPKSAAEIIDILNTQSERGADICKLVTNCDTEEAFLEAVKADMILAREFPKPFIHLSGGRYNKLHRYMGLKLGLAITFGTVDYFSAFHQPAVESFKTVRDLINWELPC